MAAGDVGDISRAADKRHAVLRQSLGRRATNGRVEPTEANREARDAKGPSRRLASTFRLPRPMTSPERPNVRIMEHIALSAAAVSVSVSRAAMTATFTWCRAGGSRPYRCRLWPGYLSNCAAGFTALRPAVPPRDPDLHYP